jgi:hypothetical protein
MGKLRHFRQHRRQDVLAGDQQLLDLEACVAGCVDEVLTLGDEQPELVAPAAVVQLADELELLVVA